MAGRDRDGAGKSEHRDRCEGVNYLSVTELAADIAPPAADRAVQEQGASVYTTTRDCRCSRDPGDSDRTEGPRQHPVRAELAVGVVPPAFDRVVRERGAGVGVASRHGGGLHGDGRCCGGGWCCCPPSASRQEERAGEPERIGYDRHFGYTGNWLVLTVSFLAVRLQGESTLYPVLGGVTLRVSVTLGRCALER